ncbi:MAG TPA: putative toxin-antitoxin system toxin component, PIN family [Blastocatellia bacterium]|nr:putative toxin-antitoxin system toxin component, PIN family [Blastocatellia bacterium]
MAKRRRQIKVVIDTNVFVGNFLARSPRSPNRRIIRSWLINRKFRIAVSRHILDEYLHIFDQVLKFDGEKLRSWEQRFRNKKLVENVETKQNILLSRDPDDNIFITTAVVAKAKFLVTNDRDLLDIEESDKRKLRFEIVTPKQFLERWDTLS